MPVVNINSNRINVTAVGGGEEIILAVHSAGRSSTQWRELGERIESPYRLVAADVYGHGKTDAWSSSDNLALSDEVDVISELVDKIPHEKLHLVGHSYGGAVALKATERLDVASLTLVEPAAFWMLRDDVPEDRDALREIQQVARLLEASHSDQGYREGMKVFVDYWSGYGTWAGIAPDQQERLVRHAPNIAMQFRALFDESMDFTVRRRINAPTLLIHGERAHRPVTRIIDRLFREITTCQVRMVEKAGHMCPCSHADQVNNMIIRHIESTGLADMPAAAVAAR